MREAGLPNIAGSCEINNADGNYAGVINTSGAIYQGASIKKAAMRSSGTALTMYQLAFSAQNSNAIYGNSTTVQPPAITMRFYIKF